MQAESADRQRQRLLRDMGIECWFLRTAPGARMPTGAAVDSGAAADSGADAGPRPARSAVEAGRPAGAARQLPAETGEDAPPPAGKAPSAPPPPAVSKPPPASQTEPAFSVVASGLPGALLVASAFPLCSGEARLAEDLVRAARRDWTAEVRHARFDWPQPGARGSSRPALAAFVEKQAEDFAAQQCLLATESVAARLQDASFQPVIQPAIIPELQSLATPEAKRKLWQQLQALGRPADGNQNGEYGRAGKNAG